MEPAARTAQAARASRAPGGAGGLAQRPTLPSAVVAAGTLACPHADHARHGLGRWCGDDHAGGSGLRAAGLAVGRDAGPAAARYQAFVRNSLGLQNVGTAR